MYVFVVCQDLEYRLSLLQDERGRSARHKQQEHLTEQERTLLQTRITTRACFVHDSASSTTAS